MWQQFKSCYSTWNSVLGKPYYPCLLSGSLNWALYEATDVKFRIRWVCEWVGGPFWQWPMHSTVFSNFTQLVLSVHRLYWEEHRYTVIVWQNKRIDWRSIRKTLSRYKQHAVNRLMEYRIVENPNVLARPVHFIYKGVQMWCAIAF